MLAADLRRKYLDFFVARGHLEMEGAPLVPIDVLGEEDRTTLFSGSGMEQFKPWFSGAAQPRSARVTTVQKCFRTTDIDSVGDLSHCTFFEMLGNFSFGDYFKAEVIPWTWEFLTEVVRLDGGRIAATVFSDDDESYAIWRDVVGLPEDRIFRLGEDKNYWPANAISQGPDGLCGPCSELYYLLGAPPSYSGDAAAQFARDEDNGLWVEIWNNVFTQFDRSTGADGAPVLTPLAGRNNDTGAGLDRIAYVSQSKRSVFETDLFAPILARVEALAKRPYGGTDSGEDFAFRVVAEHVRAMVFCIADGILPSNEGRGYVLRYIMRRAIRYGATRLGFDRPFLHEVAPAVVESMGGFYTDLGERLALIVNAVAAEEERFRHTLDTGMRRLTELFERPDVAASSSLPGEDAFTLHDTYGFPLRLTRDIAAERGIEVDQAGFDAAMDGQRERSRRASGMGAEVFGDTEASAAYTAPVRFTGYDALAEPHSRVQAIFSNGAAVQSARAGDTVELVLDPTPLYAESGGQVGDTGTITGPDHGTTCTVRADVVETRKAGGPHRSTVTIREGEVTEGDTVTVAVDADRRRRVMRNHTATHLLQAALRTVLGSHVHQKGSLVAPDRLRFDFTHGDPLTQDQLRRVERMVNERILDDTAVDVAVDVPLEDARARGAMALFGEKYGEVVRMVEIPGFSLELCGGTHVPRLGVIGPFRIVSESGVAAGVRRIEALTGEASLDWMEQRDELVARAAAALKTSPAELPAAVERLIAQRQELDRRLRDALAAGASSVGGDFEPTAVAGTRVVAARLPEGQSGDAAAVADSVAKRIESGVVVLAAAADGRVVFTAKVSQDVVARGAHAGNLVRAVAKIAGGSGGGRPDFAQAGGRDASKTDAALEAVPSLVEAQLSS